MIKIKKAVRMRDKWNVSILLRGDAMTHQFGGSLTVCYKHTLTYVRSIPFPSI